MSDFFTLNLAEFSEESSFNSEAIQTILCVMTALYYIFASYIQLDVDKVFPPIIIMDLLLSIVFMILFVVGWIFSPKK